VAIAAPEIVWMVIVPVWSRTLLAVRMKYVVLAFVETTELVQVVAVLEACFLEIRNCTNKPALYTLY
jgi:hypothetical protein